MRKNWNIIGVLMLVFSALAQWCFIPPLESELIYDVPQVTLIPFLEREQLYLMLIGITVLFPFFLSFDKKVAYFKKWKYLFPGIFIVGLVFIIWDIHFTSIGIWGFNPKYYMSAYKWLGLPLGEWLFFVVVPFSCVFIYECLKCYFPKMPFLVNNKWVDWICLLGLISYSICFYGNHYSSGNALICCAAILWISERSPAPWSMPAFIISCVPFLLIDGALTGSFTAYSPL